MVYIKELTYTVTMQFTLRNKNVNDAVYDQLNLALEGHSLSERKTPEAMDFLADNTTFLSEADFAEFEIDGIEE